MSIGSIEGAAPACERLHLFEMCTRTASSIETIIYISCTFALKYKSSKLTCERDRNREGEIHRETGGDRHTETHCLFVLLLFYILPTASVMSGPVPTCDSAHSL